MDACEERVCIYVHVCHVVCVYMYVYVMWCVYICTCMSCGVFQSLMDACEEQDIDAYTDAVKNFDSISRIDQWTTTILLRVKKSINAEDDLR
jgi:hypothetical protein